MPADLDPPDKVRWLTPDERAAWLVMVSLTSLLPPAIEAQLQRDGGLSLFEHGVLAALSEQPDRTLPMSGLAAIAGGSLSRLSHLARRMEMRGYLVRSPQPGDGRVTIATLTDAGQAALTGLAPGHVAEVRRIVLDPLSAPDQVSMVDAGLRIIASIDTDAAATLRTVIGAAADPRTDS